MKPVAPRVAIYAGSFDPFTLGHEDIVRRGAALFDRLVIAIGINPDKQPLFSAAERQEIMGDIFADLPNVQIAGFTGLTVDFARSIGASVMLRGVRTVSDIETEFTMALANHILAPDLETVFLMASERFSHISSTLIKQIATMGRDASREQLLKFIPERVVTPLLEKVQRERAEGMGDRGQ
ncbi:pantetheine-phosphate adenylyltransferase [Planctomicrobium piriforme]|uniref:Phosphopantetheine adenylyltransferase n=1 Tax=Planctomicrobium piriforme TaxID=1576369 RepID=A0A1I3J9D5_9PLAN|nr:pantetheine-phosphate adenylyltransferase [Planctomicrobium piriforme]SFI56829.1 Phosphopantetheine adenylyltransferase [Planctomicrobium piriforme]